MPAVLAASDFDPSRIPVPLLLALAAAVGAWLVLLWVFATATNPRPVRPVAGTLDLGDEPPAVVNLLVGGWRMTKDAMSATLLDLGARDLIDLDQLGPEPERTVCGVPSGSAPAGLTAYERRVYDRVAGLTVGGVVPAAALPRGSAAQAARWWRAFRREVIRDAQRRGLSRNRWGRSLLLTLQAAAVGPALVAAAAVAPAHADAGGTIAAGVIVWVALTALVARLNRQRDTPAGREAAARWLGVRDYLGRDEAFGTLPPAAVAIWDRHLAYGAAMGIAGTASRVLAFGAQDERLAWSAYGGSWHRVRIRYLGNRLVEGRHPLVACLLGAVAVVAGYFGLRLFLAVRRALDSGSGLGLSPDLDRRLDTGLTRWALFCLTVGAAAVVVWGAYTVVRAVIDLAARRAVEGEVLRLRVLRSDDRVIGHEIAVDDGQHAKLRAWPVAPGRLLPLSQGDVVRLTVGPRLRHVYRIEVLRRGRSLPEDAEPLPATGFGGGDIVPSEEDTAPAVPVPTPQRAVLSLVDSGPAGESTAVDPAALLTAEEVSDAFGGVFGPARSLTGDRALPFLGVRMCEYDGPGGARVQIQTVTGRIARAMLDRVHGEPLPGVGEEAFLRGDAVAMLCGDVGIAIRAQHVDRATARSGLTQLAATAATRLPTAPHQPA